MYKIYRILDANVNRVAEGIRVIEDLSRFYYEDIKMTERLRELRHLLRKTFKNTDDKMVNSRDSLHDIGKEISAASTLDKKTGLKQLIVANFKRVEEGLRVTEENLKIVGKYHESKIIEGLRYEAYYLEKEILKKVTKNIPEGIYGICAEKFSKGRKNTEVVLEMCKAGIEIIQYREKYKSLKERYIECKDLRKITADYGVKFIVNDNIDIAMLVDADGVHIGQDDMPITEVQKLVGDKIIGLSTHSPEQAQKAIADGADYLGVGPVFKTYTKDDVCDPVGLEYLEYAVKNVKIPFIAIGGIKEHNLNEIVSRGAKRISLVTEIVGAEDIYQKIKQIQNIIKGE